MGAAHLAALEVTITPQNWSAARHPRGHVPRSSFISSLYRPIGALTGDEDPGIGAWRPSRNESAGFATFRGAAVRPVLPQRWSAPVGVSSKTGWRCTSAVKSAMGEFLLAWK